MVIGFVSMHCYYILFGFKEYVNDSVNGQSHVLDNTNFDLSPTAKC